MRVVLVIAFLACAACSTAQQEPQPVTPVVEPHFAETVRRNAPDATAEQVERWYADFVEWNTQVEEWNACLDGNGGYDRGCIEPDRDLLDSIPL